MAKTHPISITNEHHGLAGNLVLPDGATQERPVPGAVVLGGPGPAPLQRYSAEGNRQWPVLWSEAFGAAGLAGLCYDQRGSGLSTGLYHEAAWEGLYDDAKAATEMLAIQPEVGRVAAIAWGEGAGFGLQLAAEGKVDGLILLAPGFLTAEVRYATQMEELAARKGLSDRVVQIRVNQWRSEIESVIKRVEKGETTTVTEVGGQPVTTNLLRFLQTIVFDPAPLAGRVKVPTLILHGEEDTVIRPHESESLAGALGGPVERILYPGQAHFLYRHSQATADAVAWIKRHL
ncbi:MAG: alpha/beta hydrolase [Bacillota bacterium]